MNTTNDSGFGSLSSFADIFNTTVECPLSQVKLTRIVIPKIQRDYAQGRKDSDVSRVRKRFLDALHKAVTGQPIKLDFIYGSVDEDGIMTPLDGQQRLTTLFLLHWYAARRAAVAGEQCTFLKNFSYETRYSARDFCENLVGFTPAFSFEHISDEIIDQAWFALSWKQDPTVASMLVMLDAIQKQFADVHDLWDQLMNGAIQFYFLPINNMGLTDELYITMNSRGKPLTRFEHFKAELEREMRLIDEPMAQRIAQKIDGVWTDLLWQYRNSGTSTDDGYTIDDCFLRYFRYVCGILCYEQGNSLQGRSYDELDLLTTYFGHKNQSAKTNLLQLESYFDCWLSPLGYNTPRTFLESLMAHKHTAGKILVDTGDNTDIFGDCLRNYGSNFPLRRVVLLYALTTYLRLDDKPAPREAARRLRIVDNLIRNSGNEISERADRNRMPAILYQVRAIITSGAIDTSLKPNFNGYQLEEERQKARFLAQNPDKEELLTSLEDHPLLYGQIAIIGLDHIDLAFRFASLFQCNRDKISCALMSIGNYGQLEGNSYWRYQVGSLLDSSWQALFHKSGNKDFQRTSDVLVSLLSRVDTFTNEYLQNLIDEYLEDCKRRHEYPWEYYYTKYSSYRPESYGKLSNYAVRQSYLYSVMLTETRWSSRTYIPYLKEADAYHLLGEYCGQRLVYADRYITCENAAFVVKRTDDTELERICIPQNEHGTDTEDRVEVLRSWLAKHKEITQKKAPALAT